MLLVIFQYSSKQYLIINLLEFIFFNLGCITEFEDFDINREYFIKDSWKDITKYYHGRATIGRFTDDFSMARCVADCLLVNDLQLNPLDLRIR